MTISIRAIVYKIKGLKMKKIIYFVLAIFIIGCAPKDSVRMVPPKEYDRYNTGIKIKYCVFNTDKNQCNEYIGKNALYIFVGKKNDYRQYYTYFNDILLTYPKIEAAQIDDAIKELVNFLKWANLPAQERSLKQKEYEANIKLGVLGRKYLINNNIPYISQTLIDNGIFGLFKSERRYLVDEVTTKKILVQLLIWKKVIQKTNIPLDNKK